MESNDSTNNQAQTIKAVRNPYYEGNVVFDNSKEEGNNSTSQCFVLDSVSRDKDNQDNDIVDERKTDNLKMRKRIL